LGDKHAHCLRALAAAVFNHCDGKSALAEIAARAESELGTAVSESDVRDAISQLEASGLLDVPLRVRDGLSRRDAMKRFAFAGATAAFAGPLITSIAAPSSASAAGSGIPIGCTGCGKNSDCVSNHCCQSNPGKQCNESCCVGMNNSCHITGCVCVGGSNPGTDCSACGNNCTICTGGGTCQCTCTVCVSDTGCGQCPCSQCPGGSSPCCSSTC
jgi:hypothetical protein